MLSFNQPFVPIAIICKKPDFFVIVFDSLKASQFLPGKNASALSCRAHKHTERSGGMDAVKRIGLLTAKNRYFNDF
jgi:hypothetical protein